jgi:D-glycero-D-manno-heptose 1,7-bisphosphate phosphatase
MRPAIFLDRDGVINENRSNYIKSWGDVRILPGALAALRSLTKLGWPIVVVSNQSAIGRGLTTTDAVEEIHAALDDVIASAGGRVDAYFYCPHRPNEGCDCRKPATGLLQRAAQRFGIDLSQSYMIGDGPEDVQVALAGSCVPVLVKTGRGLTTWRDLPDELRAHTHVAEDLADAAAWILGQVGRM